MTKKHELCRCENCEKERYLSPCAGCRDGHPSFWKTIIESKYWKLWEKENSRRLKKLCNGGKEKCYDVDECRELGAFGKEHFEEFIKFIKTL